MSFVSSLRCACDISQCSPKISDAKTPKFWRASEISEDVDSRERRRRQAAFTHIPDPSSISLELALAGMLARFLRLEVWDVVCHLSELRVASIYMELSALAIVTGIGLPPLPDATEADKQGDIRCQREVTAVRRR
jgi:hypothetical protein